MGPGWKAWLGEVVAERARCGDPWADCDGEAEAERWPPARKRPATMASGSCCLNSRDRRRAEGRGGRAGPTSPGLGRLWAQGEKPVQRPFALFKTPRCRWTYLDGGRLRCGNSQQHLGHLVDDQLRNQLSVLLHVLPYQGHGAVHHLQGRRKNRVKLSLGGAIAPPVR